MLSSVRRVRSWERGRNVISNDAASNVRVGCTLRQSVLDRFADDGVLATQILQELTLVPAKGAITILVGVNNGHVVDYSSRGIGEWIDDLVPPDELGKRVEDSTHIRARTVKSTVAIRVVDIAVFVELKLEDSSIRGGKSSPGRSLDDNRVAWHLAELQLKVVAKVADSIGRLVESRGLVREFGRGVLLGCRPPTIWLRGLEWVLILPVMRALLGSLLKLTSSLLERCRLLERLHLVEGVNLLEVPVRYACRGHTRNKKSSDLLHY